MWVVADIRAHNSLATAQRAKHAQQATDTAQSAPALDQPPTAESAPSQQPAQHQEQLDKALPAPSQRPSQRGEQSGDALQGNKELPWGALHPLELLHKTLGTIAGRLVLQQVHAGLQKLMGENGRWAKLLKLNAAAVLPNGIR